MTTKFLCVALAMFSSYTAAQTYTFQTSPASGEFLRTDAAMAIRWENRAGSSPDSPNVATPAMVTVSLGFKQGENPVVLWPPISGPTSNVPTAAGSWIWQKMDFNGFANGPVPARDMNTNWFIRLADQSTGYVSNGQLFKLLDAGPTNSTAAPVSPPPATSAATPTSTPASSSSAAASSSSAPAATGASSVAASATASTARPTGTQDASKASSASAVKSVVAAVVAPLMVAVYAF